MKNLLVLGSCLLALGGNLSLRSWADQLTLGATVSGQINQPGQVDQYTFNGSPGLRLLYDALDSDSLSMNARLIAPSGTVLFDRNSRSDVEPITVLESGIYTLLIDGNGSTVGAYNFRLVDISAPPPLALDTVITKTLTPGILVDVYPFAGVAGQHLFFDGLGANGGAGWYLYGPNNQNLGGSGSIGGDFAWTLTQTGLYVVVVYGSSPAPLPYSFRVVNSTWTTNSMTLGSTLVGSVIKPGDQQSYTFTGTVGQRLMFDGLDTDSLQINARLVSPFGNVVFDRNSRNDVEPFTLTESGTYTLVLYGSGSTVGGYKCRLLDVSASASLPFDTIVTKTLDPGTAIEVYPFAGSQGQHLYFHGLGANSGGSWYLYSPNNQNLGGAGIGGDFELTLPVNGPYLLVEYGNSPNPLPYSFQVVREASPSVPLVLGSTVSGNIARAGDQAMYTFAGTAGQRIYYDSLDRDFEQIYSRLIAPSGALVWDFTNQSSDLGPFSLLESGTYTLVIDGSVAATGDFRFRLLDLSQAQPLGLSGPTSGQLNPASATEAYQLNGTAGQRLNFKMISSTSNQGDWRLVGPAGQIVGPGAPNFPSDLGDIVLPVTGPYWLLMEGTSDSIAPLSYQFAATDHTATAVAVSGLGDIRTGTIAAGQQDTLSFSAPAGLWVYFDSQDRTSGNLVAELKDPTGTVAAQFPINAANDFGPYVLPLSGNYTLTIRGANASLTGTFRYRLMDLSTGALPLAMNTILTANLDPGYRTDIYQFQGQPGQRLLYDALDNDFANVAVRLVAPDGQLKFINGNSDSDVGPFTLAAPGTYYLVFENNLATPAAYKARLLDVATQPELTFGAPASPTIDPGLGTVLYRIPSTPGQRLFFDGLTSSAQGSWALYGPNNDYVGGTSLNADFEFVTVQTGTYLLLLVGANAGGPISTSYEAYKLTGQSDRPQFTLIDVFAGTATLVWNATAGKTYRVQYTADLGQPNWSDLAGDVTATGGSATKSDDSLGNALKRIYRLKVLP